MPFNVDCVPLICKSTLSLWWIDAVEGKQKKYNGIAECISMAFPKANEMEFFILNVTMESEREMRRND